MGHLVPLLLQFLGNPGIVSKARITKNNTENLDIYIFFFIRSTVDAICLEVNCENIVKINQFCIIILLKLPFKSLLAIESNGMLWQEYQYGECNCV